jgi:hypothetical protein
MPGGGGGGPGVGPGGGAGVVPGAHVGGWNVSNPVLISTVSNLYAHTITVYNPGNTPETISDLSAFASMSFVTSDQLSTLDYGTPLVSSVVLAPDSSTSVNLITSGDMGGGEIYLSYVTDDSDPWYTFGEHPIPEPSNLAMLGLGTLVLLTYEWRRLKAKA